MIARLMVDFNLDQVKVIFMGKKITVTVQDQLMKFDLAEAKLFRLRFRVPYKLFIILLDWIIKRRITKINDCQLL